MVESKDHFRFLCLSFHSTSIKEINTIENATKDLLCQNELAELKDVINEEATKHIAYICLTMEELIEAYVRVNLMTSLLTYNTLIKNLTDIDSNNIYERCKLAFNKLVGLRESKLFAKEIVEIIEYCQTKMDLLLNEIPQEEQNVLTLN